MSKPVLFAEISQLGAVIPAVGRAVYAKDETASFHFHRIIDPAAQH
jgi:hypothetical protein